MNNEISQSIKQEKVVESKTTDAGSLINNNIYSIYEIILLIGPITILGCSMYSILLHIRISIWVDISISGSGSTSVRELNIL